MTIREYETHHVSHTNYTEVTPIGNYEEQLRNNGYIVVEITGAWE